MYKNKDIIEVLDQRIRTVIGGFIPQIKINVIDPVNCFEEGNYDRSIWVGVKEVGQNEYKFYQTPDSMLEFCVVSGHFDKSILTRCIGYLGSEKLEKQKREQLENYLLDD